MNLRRAGISICLCSCLLAAPSSWAADPSPFLLPPETEQEAAPTAVAPSEAETTDAAPTTSQPGHATTVPGQPTPSSQFTPSPSAQPPVDSPVTDPEAAFDLPSSGPSSTGTPPAGAMPVQEPQSGVFGGVQSDLSAAALLAQGTDLARQGRYEEARVALENALLKDPNNVLSLNNLGLVMRKLGRIEEATRAYTTAIQKNPGFALTYKNYGILLEQNGEDRRAVDAYRKYCSLAPHAPDAQKVSQRADWLAGGL